jgi:hypothetical protein
MSGIHSGFGAATNSISVDYSLLGSPPVVPSVISSPLFSPVDIKLPTVLSGLSSEKYEKLKAQETIQRVADRAIFFEGAPDIGMDRFLVDTGRQSVLGTSGVGSCFATCLIGKTRAELPVIGLYHVSSWSLACAPFENIVGGVKSVMVHQGGAVQGTIKTYVVGGQAPSEIEPEGTVADEERILAVAESVGVEGVLFNLTRGDDEMDAINVAVTPSNVYVSRDSLFPAGMDIDGVGMSLWG